MQIKEVDAKIIKDSRGEDTVEVLVKSDDDIFSGSAPFGKSVGRHETPSFAGNIKNSIKNLKNLSDKLEKLEINEFLDLEAVEEIAKKEKVGANILYSLEVACLKALAAEQDKELWQIINPKAKHFPAPIGNCIGGGLHSSGTKKPEFQEFHIIPRVKHFSDAVFIMKKCHEICGKRLELLGAKGKLNDENAWSTTLDNEQVLKVMRETREELVEQLGRDIDIGVDVAASSFFKNGKYNYKDKQRNQKEQLKFLSRLAEDYELLYLEDPFHEEDFDGFGMMMDEVMKFDSCLVVADDLTASQIERVKEAIKRKCIYGVILKPNQNGSLLELAKISQYCKQKGVKTIVSHRSGETMDYALADIAFGLQADYIKTGVLGKEREIKLNRMIEIEKEIEK
jgi:enolase